MTTTATATDATTADDTSTDGGDSSSTDSTSTDTGTDTAAELEKWKAAARKHEQRAKENAAKAKDYDTLKQQSMTEQEKAVDTARSEARAEALKEVGTKLTVSAIRVAATGRVADIDALLEGVDASKFTDDDGEPNEKAIAAWIDRIAPVAEGTGKPAKRDLGQGVRNGGQSSNTDDDASTFAAFRKRQLES